MKYLISLGVAAFVVLVIFFSSFALVGAGQRGVVLRFGAVSRVIDEGFNLKTPFIERVVRMDVKIKKNEVEASAASQDLQTVTTKVALNYHLDAARVGDLYKGVGLEYEVRIIDPAVQEAIKATTSRFSAEELITKRSEVKQEAKLMLSERLLKDGIIVDDLSFVNFDFSKSFNEAIESKVTAEQNALAAKNKLEQVKFEAQQQIETAKAQAESIKIQAQAVNAQGGADYVKLQAINKWDGKLPVSMPPNGTVPFIDLK